MLGVREMKGPIPDWLSRATALPLLIAGLANFGWAQSPDNPSFSVDVRLVSVVCSVRDKQGRFVTGLSRDDFEVLDNGRRRQITHFSEEGASPLTVALLIDTSSSALDILDEEKESARRFFAEMLGPADRAMLVGFGRRVFIWQDLTSLSADLNSALARVRPLESDDPKAGTLLYDAVYTVAREKLKGMSGRKVVVILSDGLDNGGAFGQRDAIKAAQEADAVVFGIHKLDSGQFNFQRPVDGTMNGGDYRMGKITGDGCAQKTVVGHGRPGL